MGRVNATLFAFNRGLLSPLALGRIDWERQPVSAETYTNWMPRALGSMMLRPGTQYIGTTYSNGLAKYLPFVFSTDDVALVEITDSLVRVWVDDALVTRASVSAAITNGAFTSDVASWTDADESGATSAWVTGGYLGLTGTGVNAAIRRQQVTVTETGTEHALAIVVQRGPTLFSVGSSAGVDDYIAEQVLDTGTHSLAFTPTGNFWVEFKSRVKRQILIDSVSVEASGTMTITAPWAEADLNLIRYDQSGDILFIACDGYQQYKIERRGTTSWSVVKYVTDDGPFKTINVSETTITPSAISGNITLTASTDIFTSDNVGSLYRLTSTGQTVNQAVSAEDTWTNAIEVTGTGSNRIFTIIRDVTSGTAFKATVTLQRSLTADTGPWENVTTYTTVATITYDDALDNQIAYYRIGVDTGNYTSETITGATQANPCVVTVTGHSFLNGENVYITGVVGMTELNGNTYTVANKAANTFELSGIDSTGYTAYTSGGLAESVGIDLTLDYPIGSVDGVVRVTAYSSDTSVSAEVITDLGGTDATYDWYEGEWSPRRGYPTAVAFAEGRLAWSGRNGIWLSVSDSYYSFDDTIEGDSAPLSRTIGSGPVDQINWLLAMKRLILGAEGAEFACRSSGEDEPLTTTNFTIKSFSTQGSANTNAVKVDKNGIFTQRGGTRVYEMTFGQDWEFESNDLTLFYPEAGSSQITHLAVQRQPDTRIHCVRSDGAVSILIYDRAEKILCWVNYSTDGIVEDVVVLPGADGQGEDDVYYVVQRTINGATKRYLEKWALESQCQGGTVNRQADSFYIYSGVSTSTITGLSHLEGETVVVWGGGKDLGTATVSGGQITTSEAVTSACIGLGYTAQWKSTKLAYAGGMGTALTQKKRVTGLGVILYNTHYQGLEYGPDFTNMDNLPLMKDEAETSADTVHSTFDEEMFSFPGVWDSDSRLCLQATAPKPCTILVGIVGVETHDR